MILVLICLPGCQRVAVQSAKATTVTHLTLWHGVNPPPNRDVLQGLVDQFNQTHPDIHVESLYVGQPDQQMPKLFAAIAGNAAPDLLWFSPLITGQLWELDALQPLEDWFYRSPLQQELDPALFSSMYWDNHIWSLPFGTNNLGLFYRPSLFKAAGIAQIPQTWDQLKTVAHQLTQDTNGDGRLDQHGLMLSLGRGDWTVFTWLPFMWSSGGELFGASDSPALSASVDLPRELAIDSGAIDGETVIPGWVVPPLPDSADHPTILNPGAIAALELWQDLVKEGSAILSQPERGYELDAFLSGKVAMQLTGPWTLGQLAMTDTDFAVMPIPYRHTPVTATGGENLFMLKTDPAKAQAAWTFMEYLVSEASQTFWALGTGYLPVNLKSRQSGEYRAFVDQQPALNVFLDQAQDSRSRPIGPGYNHISDNLGRAIETVLLNQATPEVALKTYQERLELALPQN